MVANYNLIGIYNMIMVGVIDHLSDQRDDPLNKTCRLISFAAVILGQV